MKKYYSSLFILAIVIGICLLYYTTSNGLVITDDSYYYLSKAQQFAVVKSFHAIGFKTIFPFQTLEIYIIYLFGEHWEPGIRLLNYFCWTGTFSLNILIAKQLFKKELSVVFFGGLMLFSTPYLMVHSFLWTEPLFILLLSLQLYLLWSFIQSRNAYLLIPILLLSIVYCWQRKAGMLFSVGITFSLIFLLIKSNGLKIGIISILIIATFLLYGGFGFPNQIGELPFIDGIGVNLYNYFATLSAWILPMPLNYNIRIGLLLLLIIGYGYYLQKIRTSVDPQKFYFLLCLITIFIIYFGIRQFYYRPNYHEAERFLAPLYALFFFFIIFVTEHISLHKYHRRLGFTFFMILLLWFAYPITRTIKNARLWHNHNKKSLSIKEPYSKPVQK